MKPNRPARTVPATRFVDVPTGQRGACEAGLADKHDHDGLFGPKHAEATGIFEQSGLIVALGAKRQ